MSSKAVGGKIEVGKLSGEDDRRGLEGEGEGGRTGTVRTRQAVQLQLRGSDLADAASS